MAIGTNALKAGNPFIIDALNYIEYVLGGSYRVSVKIPLVGQELWQAYEKQGGDLEEVNLIREKYGLYKLTADDNIKIVKKSWGKNIIKGNGCVFIIRKYAVNYKENRDISKALDWVTKKYPDFKVDKVSLPGYDSFYIGYKFKEAKEEEVMQEVIKEEEVKQEEIQQDNNEAAI